MSKKLRRFITLILEAIIIVAFGYLVLLAFDAVLNLFAEPFNNALWGAWEAVNATL